MAPQPSGWHRNREGPLSRSAPRRRGPRRDGRATPGARALHIVTANKPKGLAGLSHKGTGAGTRTLPCLVMGSHATAGQSAPPPCGGDGDGPWPPRPPPARASKPEGTPRGGRAEEEGRRARSPVTGARGVALPGHRTPRASAQTSLWSWSTRDLGQPLKESRQRTAGTTRTGARSDRPTAWHAITWDAVHRQVRRLPARRGQAGQAKRWGQGQAWHPLRTHACSGTAVAVQRVTTNDGSQPPGGDEMGWAPPAQQACALEEWRQRG